MEFAIVCVVFCFVAVPQICEMIVTVHAQHVESQSRQRRYDECLRASFEPHSLMEFLRDDESDGCSDDDCESCEHEATTASTEDVTGDAAAPSESEPTADPTKEPLAK